MNTFRLTVASPDGKLFDNDVYSFSVRGIEGDLAIMAGHIPFITNVKECVCRIEKDDGTEIEAKTDGGLLTVSGTEATLLTGIFEIE